MKKTGLWRGLTPVLWLLFTLCIGCTLLLMQWAGQVDRVLGITHDTVSGGDGEIVYKSDYAEADGSLTDAGREKLRADLRAHGVQTMEEGAVLLKNDGALPFADDIKNVTLLGRASADPVYRNTSGGPSFDPSDGVTLKAALEGAGLSVNNTVYDAYAASDKYRDKVTGDIGEEDPDFFTNDIISSFDSYNDAAIVVLSRYSGEGNDLLTKDIDGISQLALHPDEQYALQVANEHFDTVILLVNSGNPLELGWLDNEQYGVDAALWIGTPGQYGMEGVANILTGAANPSGGLIDTYASDSLSSAAAQNFGDYTYANAAEMGLKDVGLTDVTSKYLVQAEGIYVGYKYYETRYEDSVLGRYNADSKAGTFASGGAWNYAEEVAFPFGFGLSYTTFSYEITELKADGAAGVEFAVTVRVTNTGEVEGKTPVQIYVQTPYTDYDREHLVEKPAVTLVGFDKTGDIAPGEYEDVTVNVDKYLLASYDTTAHSGEGGYILDEGSYYFGTGNGAHEALNNILALKAEDENLSIELYDHDGVAVEGNASAAKLWQLDEFDDSTYAESNGNRVDNKMEEADLNYWQEGAVTYLTRQDWNTFPKSYTGLNATQEMADILNKDTLGDGTYEMYEKPAGAPGKSTFTVGAPVTIKFIEMRGVAYDDDEKWNAFLDQLTVAQLAAMTKDMSGISAIASIGFPGIGETDGPDGAGGIQYVGESVAAAAFSPEILADRGNLMGEEALFNSLSAQWSPGGNIHRTPFGGRNFEYYSECANMSYLCAGIQCEAMQAKGLIASIKHFCGNDQETNRKGVCTFMNEQGWRQGPLRGFEGAFTKGASLGTMTAYNRYGLILTAECSAVNNDILRGEWGFKGFTITDAGSGSALDDMVGGTDVNCMKDYSREIITQINTKDDGNMLGIVRNANKNVFYTLLQSNIVNGLSVDSVISEARSWWQYVVFVIDGVVGVAAVGSTAMYVLSRFVRNKKKEVA